MGIFLILVIGYVAWRFMFGKTPSEEAAYEWQKLEVAAPKMRVTAQKILADAKKNILGAESKYAESVEIVAAFENAEQAFLNESAIKIKLFDPALGSLEGLVEKKHMADVSKISSGTLISVACAKLKVVHGTVRFTKCRKPAPYPLGEQSAAMVYDKMLAEELKR